MSLNITAEEWAEFEKHYVWQKLQTPSYRFGQAFINYFPGAGAEIANGSDEGTIAELRLYYEEDESRARAIVETYLK